ncbi:34881_t:CDS:2, partial [Racocetra persica]
QVNAKLGKTTTLLVQGGTLRAKDLFLTNGKIGKIKRMLDFQGKIINQVFSGDAAQIIGLDFLSEAGEKFLTIPDDKLSPKISKLLATLEALIDLVKKQIADNPVFQIVSGSAGNVHDQLLNLAKITQEKLVELARRIREKKQVEKILGTAEVVKVIYFSKIGYIAGCQVISGMIERNNLIYISRKGEKIFSGKMKSLEVEKEKKEAARKGQECGIVIENFDEFQEKDQIIIKEKKLSPYREQDLIRLMGNLEAENILEPQEVSLLRAAFNFDEESIDKYYKPRRK